MSITDQPPVAAPQSTDRRRRFVVLALRTGLLLAILYLVLRWFEQTQVFHPSRTFDASPASSGLAWEDAHFTATDGVKLHGWFFPAATNSSRRDRAFLVCHGNGGNISHRLGLTQLLLQTGAAVLLFDYRGYGHSEGQPSETGTCLDAQAAHSWLRGKGFPAPGIMVLGESLGGAVASELALREPVGGLVLQSTFTSIPDLGHELFPWLPVRTLASIRYDTHSKLSRITVPVLVLHSRRDSLIAFHHAERNFAAARRPKLFAELAGDHNDPVWEEAAYRDALERFLSSLTKAGEGGGK
jgi:fermentation-respiration switch protein FrsA (DUF1100 family)